MRKGLLLKRMVLTLAFCAFLSVLAFGAQAEEGTSAKDLTALSEINIEGFLSPLKAYDGKASHGAQLEGDDGIIQVTSKEPIGALYMRFNEITAPYMITANGKQIIGGENLFLHEYLDIQKAFGSVNQLTLHFHADCNISEITVLSPGEKPENMQIWSPVFEDADLLLFSSHSDDDQLFFAGVIPRYCAEGYRVQVAYLTNHPDWPVRRHELLDGLWAAGCTNYPVMGTFADFRKDDLDKTVAQYEELGVSYDEIAAFVVETIRKTKPLVVVSHDINGEYGHGMHLLLSKLIREQTPFCADPTAFPESAKNYGVWQVKKTYIHLYEENESGMVLDIDTPLDYFGGKTAFQVSQASFLNCHPSQHGGWYFRWQQGTEDHKVMSSAELDKYNPAFYGLYHSTVGADVVKTDFFENLMSRQEMEEEEKRLKEEAKRLEQQEKTDLQNQLLKEQQKTKILLSLVVALTVGWVTVLLFHLRSKRQHHMKY